MKLNLFTLMLMFTITCFAQYDSTQTTSKREIKINLFNLIVYQAADLSYEYVLNENQSLGVGLLLKLKPIENRKRSYFETEIGNNRIFSMTPYYRYFFSKNFAKGFFIEGFAMYAIGKELTNSFSINDVQHFGLEEYSVFRLGISLGVKIIIKKALPMDINFGMGINPLRISSAWAGPATRGGISLGYRF